MVKDYNDPRVIKENIRKSKERYVCLNCFDTKERNIKKESILREPKKTFLFFECDDCAYNSRGRCDKCPKGDVLGGRDYDYIPVTHRCVIGRSDRAGSVMSMSELCCPVCKKLVHKIIGKNYIISIVGSRDSGKSHYIGVLLHEFMNSIAEGMNWRVIPEENTRRLYDVNFSKIYSTKQVLSLTEKNIDGYYEPYIFYVFDGKGKNFTVTFFDTAGEDFESDDLLENSAKHAFHACGIIFLIDPLKIEKIESMLNEDIIKHSSSVSSSRAFKNDVILSILSIGFRNHYHIKEKHKINIPMAILIPKIDVIFSDFPDHYALRFKSSHLRNNGFFSGENKRVNVEVKKWLSMIHDSEVDSFLSQLDINYNNFSFFGASSLGINNSPDKNGIFSLPVPHRIEDPFLWILKENGVIKGR